MGKTTVTYKELRFLNLDDPHGTNVYVLLESGGDHVLGLAGWHFKRFDPIPVPKILELMETDNCLLWPLSAPPRS